MIYFQLQVQEVSSKDSRMSGAGNLSTEKYHLDKSDHNEYFFSTRQE